jgi:hypothetical protein
VGHIGERGYSLYSFRCSESFDHPPAAAVQ